MSPTPSRRPPRPRATTHRDPMLATPKFPTRDARIKWLLDFLRTDCTSLTKTQVQSLNKEVIEFVDVGPTGAIFTPPPGALTRPALGRLATSVQNGIVALETGHRWELDRPVKTALVQWGKTITTSYIQGSLTTLFRAAAMAVVQDAWPTLHRCPQCAELFRKVGKQRYCSGACSQRYRWQKFIGNGRTRDYRREREQAAKRKYGSNVRIGRRRSSK